MNIEDKLATAQNYNALSSVARDLKCNRRFAKLVREQWPYFGAKVLSGNSAYSEISWYAFLENHSMEVDVLRDFFEEARAYLLAQASSEATEEREEPASTDKKSVDVDKKTVSKFELNETSYKKEGENMTAGMNITLPFNDILKHMSNQMVPAMGEFLEKRAAEIAATMTPTVIQIAGKKSVPITGKKHKSFEQAVTLISVIKSLFIAGETGSGKTHLSAQIAEALNLSFGFISCTVGMSEAHLTGRMTATGDFISTEFLKAYEQGGVFLFDEVDAADPNILLVINSALSNGRLSVPNRKEKTMANRHEDFYCIVAANTWGHGSFDYSGREQLDRAFLDRFNLVKILVEYDEELELELTQNSEVTKMLQNARQAKINRSISTRTIISAHKLAGVYKEPGQLLSALTIDWTDQERSRVREFFKV